MNGTLNWAWVSIIALIFTVVPTIAYGLYSRRNARTSKLRYTEGDHKSELARDFRKQLEFTEHYGRENFSETFLAWSKEQHKGPQGESRVFRPETKPEVRTLHVDSESFHLQSIAATLIPWVEMLHYDPIPAELEGRIVEQLSLRDIKFDRTETAHCSSSSSSSSDSSSSSSTDL